MDLKPQSCFSSICKDNWKLCQLNVTNTHMSHKPVVEFCTDCFLYLIHYILNVLGRSSITLSFCKHEISSSMEV